MAVEVLGEFVRAEALPSPIAAYPPRSALRSAPLRTSFYGERETTKYVEMNELDARVAFDICIFAAETEAMPASQDMNKE